MRGKYNLILFSLVYVMIHVLRSDMDGGDINK